MQKISALKQQHRNKKRVSVFLDDEFAFGLPDVVAAKLQVGQMVSAETIHQLQTEATFEAAKLSAIRFLAHRPRSIREASLNLRKKAYEAPVIERTIEWLESEDLLNDRAFADYWIDQRETFRPRSHFALQQELAQKGVSRSIVDEALAEIDEEASARQAAEKRAYRWREQSEEIFKRKLGQFLQRRGFRYSTIRPIVNEQWALIETEKLE